MGKKAAFLLAEWLLKVLTFVLALLAVVAWFARMVPPSVSWFISIMGLMMLPLLGLNLLFCVVWMVRRKWSFVFPLVALLLNMGFITSMFQVDFRSSEASSPVGLKLATYNIHSYGPENFVRKMRNVLGYMREEGVDVICLQESRHIPTDQLDSLLVDYPYRAVNDLSDDGMHLAILSRYPLTETRLLNFAQTSNCAMWVELEVDGHKFRLFNVHFQTTNLNQSQSEINQLAHQGLGDLEGTAAFRVIMDRLSGNARKREVQVAAVREQIAQSGTREVLVCGDFNDTPASYTYHAMVEVLDDGFKTAGSGYAYTFQPFMHLLRLDYILHSPSCEAVTYYSRDCTWSDHNPVFLELSFTSF